jgi:outer membrane protein OmpA-like peptidoglycan-associated protein
MRTLSGHHRFRIRPTLALAAAAATSAILAPRAANAQILERFALRGEFGVGTMISEYQRDTLHENVMIQGSGRLGFSIIDMLAVQASFTSWYAPNDFGGGQQYSVLGGLRFEPRIGRVGRLFVDANVGLGQTVRLSRLSFDIGLGFEFAATRWLALGPVVRYAHLFATEQDYPSDGNFWTGGLSVSLRVPPPPARSDSDNDGVLDPDDLCPAVPMGDHPDPARRGCPLRDTDRDAVFDPDDLCPTVPAGDHPDPARRGCPEGDSDHDGVLDHADQCPTTPAGEHPDPERAGCPDGDDDADHVLTHTDQCRTEPAGVHPDAARPGCPAPDRDHDTVPDPTDACPDQPGAPSPDPRRNGCPGLVRIENGQIRIMQPVFFATNRDVILPRSNAVLRAVADALRASPEIRRVSIEGHTDDVGNDAANLDLSQRRANNVMAALITDGVEAARLEAHGYGETRPLVQGTTRPARAANRRVEFHIIDPAQPAASGTPASSAAPAPSAMPAVSTAPAASGAPAASAAPGSRRPPGASAAPARSRTPAARAPHAVGAAPAHSATH